MVVMASYLGVFEFLRLVSFVDICKKNKIKYIEYIEHLVAVWLVKCSFCSSLEA